MPVDAKQTAPTSAGTTALGWIPLNHRFGSPFNVSFGVVRTGDGTRTFQVQHTFDDVFDSSVTPVAFTHADVTAATESIDGNYAYPVKAVRLNITAASGASTVTFHVLQTEDF